MSSFSLQQVEALFDEVVAQPAHDRETFLQSCSAPPELVRQVRALLVADTAADQALASVVADAAAEVISATARSSPAAPSTLVAGALAGEWRLLRVLG
jgi:hypothetical protein